MTNVARRLSFLLLILFVGVAVACAPVEEPADPTPEPEPEASAPAAPPAEAPPAEAPPEDNTPAAPQLQGNIIISQDEFDWQNTTQDNTGFWWQMNVNNDTTQTLRITVKFTFLDESDDAVRSEEETIRLAPATSRMVRGEGTMNWDQANQIVSYLAEYLSFDIVDS